MISVKFLTGHDTIVLLLLHVTLWFHSCIVIKQTAMFKKHWNMDFVSTCFSEGLIMYQGFLVNFITFLFIQIPINDQSVQGCVAKNVWFSNRV